MKRTKEQGITLIALVITIIVLLILAGVVLATLTGNSSIIDNANYAVGEYSKSANADQNVLNKVEDLFAKYMGTETKYTITYNANGGTGTMEEEEASRTATSTFIPPEGKQFKEWNTAADGSGTSYAAGAQIPSNVDLYAIWYDPLSAHVSVGDYIEYNPTLGVTNQSLINYTSSVGTIKVKSGNDYVLNEDGTNTESFVYNGAYNLINQNGEIVTEGYTVESDIPGNGYGNQEFEASSTNNLWLVLGIDEETGMIKIVPDSAILTKTSQLFTLKGLRGYKNGETELDNISRIFGYGQGADSSKTRSIRLDEINVLTHYSPSSRSYTIEGINKTFNDNSCYYTDDDDGYGHDIYTCDNDKINNLIYIGKNNWIANKVVVCEEHYGEAVGFSVSCACEGYFANAIRYGYDLFEVNDERR
ncbi:MAG: InlB B-repeat-containing protein [Clostridia bacterium]|nr:InlB B-repeat-containing protein [Clostridia bacterium]